MRLKAIQFKKDGNSVKYTNTNLEQHKKYPNVYFNFLVDEDRYEVFTKYKDVIFYIGLVNDVYDESYDMSRFNDDESVLKSLNELKYINLVLLELSKITQCEKMSHFEEKRNNYLQKMNDEENERRNKRIEEENERIRLEEESNKKTLYQTINNIRENKAVKIIDLLLVAKHYNHKIHIRTIGSIRKQEYANITYISQKGDLKDYFHFKNMNNKTADSTYDSYQKLFVVLRDYVNNDTNEY